MKDKFEQNAIIIMTIVIALCCFAWGYILSMQTLFNFYCEFKKSTYINIDGIKFCKTKDNVLEKIEWVK